MTRTKRLRILAETYAKLPEVGCKGMCADTCGGVPMFPIEREQLEAKAGRPLREPPHHITADLGERITLTGPTHQACPFLVLDRCTAYEIRPLICRVYGAAEGLRCPHGCTPTRVVPDAEIHEMMARVEAL